MKDDGFTLIEIVVVLAIVALLAGLALPILKPASTPDELDAYAMRIATVLKGDRLAAIRSGTPVVTRLSARDRTVASGHDLAIVQAPAEFALDAALAQRCAGAPNKAGIVFFPSGLSCGGVIELARASQRVQIRVDWLTGGVEIVAAN